MELLFYKLCFKLLKTFKLLHKTVDSRDCGASERKEGKYRRKKDYSKVLNLLLLNIASSCENVLNVTFLIATCICVQTGQSLLNKSTFSCGMAKYLFFHPMVHHLLM